MTVTTHHYYSLAPARPRQALSWPRLIATLALWRQRTRTRRGLAALTARELADIGLTRTQQRIECAKPFWQA